jgi:hypothetical protein
MRVGSASGTWLLSSSRLEQAVYEHTTLVTLVDLYFPRVWEACLR